MWVGAISLSASEHEQGRSEYAAMATQFANESAHGARIRYLERLVIKNDMCKNTKKQIYIYIYIYIYINREKIDIRKNTGLCMETLMHRLYLP